MMTNTLFRRRCLAAIAAGLLLGLGVGANLSSPSRLSAMPADQPTAASDDAEQKTTKASRSTRPSGSSGSGKAGSGVEAKVDEILSNQRRILSRLDEVMEELKIVKIRATMR